MLQDRPYQNKAEAVTLSEYDKGVRRMMHVMATGTGKTIVFGKLYKALKSRLPGQMLVLAHTDELVRQNAAKIFMTNPLASGGIEMAGEYADPNADIINASVQTLGRKGTERVKRFNWANIDKVVIDEAHHSTADSYKRVLDAAGFVTDPASNRVLDAGAKLLLGFTATPRRMDGIALDTVFEKVGFVYSIREAIDEGWLADLRGYRIRTDTSLDSVSRSGGDFVQSELQEAVDNPARNKRIAEVWIRSGEDRPTIAFCAGIEHAQNLARTFSEMGVSAAALWGDDPDRAEKLRRHRAGEIRVLCNCSVLIEGYDDWSVSCVLLACPTESPVKFAQMIGRSTRLQEGCPNLKDELRNPRNWDDGYFIPCWKRDSLVFDFVDDSTRHSVLTLPTLMGLQRILDLNGGSLLEAVKTLEEAAEEHQSVDFSKLDSLTKLGEVIEQVDLMQVRFPEEVEANSELTWYRAVDGGFKMLIPKEGPEKAGHVRIAQNALGRWELAATIKEEEYHGVRDTMEDMFKVADNLIRKNLAAVTISKILRSAKWHGNPVSDGQKNILTKLFPKRVFPWDQMNQGVASRLIGERLTRRAK
jgi:ATP-dependent helicase IRC3